MLTAESDPAELSTAVKTDAAPAEDPVIATMRELYLRGDADGALSLAALVADAVVEVAPDSSSDDIQTLWDSTAVPTFRTLILPERRVDAATAALLGLIDGETPLARIFDRLPPGISESDALAAFQALIDDGVIAPV